MKSLILDILKRTNDPVSGELISKECQISRAGIWKYIHQLRKEGYVIEAATHVGYRLKKVPDKLLPYEINHGLKTDFLGRKIFHFDSMDTTMKYAFQLGVDNQEQGAVVIAEQQTMGKGRLGRKWSSPKSKGIYCSMLLRPRMSPTDVAQLTLMSAVAVCEAINSTLDIQATIKWPNDILVCGKKVAGILTELSAEMERVRFVVVGIGINTHTTLKNLPDNATSLRYHSENDISRAELLKSVLLRMEYWYKSVEKEGFDLVIERWKELTSTLGRKIKIGDVEGEAIGLDEYGGLIVRNGQGEIIKRMTGDVVEV